MSSTAYSSGPRRSSLAGSRTSVLSGTTNIRITNGTKSRRMGKPGSVSWHKRPLVSSAVYTTLQRGAWHIGFYSVFLSIWTVFTSAFDIYLLHAAAPGSSHTGYYIFSFDFVYVGNPHVRNLLMMSSILSMVGGAILLLASVVLLDGLRKEDEKAFKFWLWTMGIMAPWKIVSWAFAGIVNDMIFVYNILMLLVWLVFHLFNCWGWVCIYSLYLELYDVTRIQDLTKLKMETLSQAPSRAAGGSIYSGSRPTSPYVVNRQPTQAYGSQPMQPHLQHHNSDPSQRGLIQPDPAPSGARAQPQTHASDIF